MNQHSKNCLTLNDLACITPDAQGSRCSGRIVATDNSQLSCVACHASYKLINDIPVFQVDINSQLYEFYSGAYKEISRPLSMLEGGPRMEQAKVFWNLLPELVEKNHIEGLSLEIGCGPGIFADRCLGYVGLDYALNALLAKGFESYDRVCASGDLLPFRNETFSLIFSLNTLEHVPDLDQSIYEIDRVLKLGGYLLLRPAWNCTQYNCDGVSYFAYRELSIKNKLKKLFLPILKSKIFKALVRIPKRLIRETLLRTSQVLHWRRLNPRFDLMYKVADSEAYSSLDTHECIFWFSRKGYHCISHPTFFRRIFAGHDIVLLQKKV
jgi:SAM-dependent methyltransferase